MCDVAIQTNIEINQDDSSGYENDINEDSQTPDLRQGQPTRAERRRQGHTSRSYRNIRRFQGSRITDTKS